MRVAVAIANSVICATHSPIIETLNLRVKAVFRVYIIKNCHFVINGSHLFCLQFVLKLNILFVCLICFSFFVHITSSNISNYPLGTIFPKKIQETMNSELSWRLESLNLLLAFHFWVPFTTVIISQITYFPYVKFLSYFSLCGAYC